MAALVAANPSVKGLMHLNGFGSTLLELSSVKSLMDWAYEMDSFSTDQYLVKRKE